MTGHCTIPTYLDNVEVAELGEAQLKILSRFVLG
jgi:hypothetical protein